MTTCELTQDLSQTLAHAADSVDFARHIQSTLADLAAPERLWRRH